MRHIRPSDTCAQLRISCPLPHLRAELVPLMAPCWCFTVHGVEHIIRREFTNIGQTTSVKITISSGLPTMRKAGKEKRESEWFSNDGQMLSEASGDPQLWSGKTGHTECSDSNSTSQSLSRDSPAQQYLLQNTQGQNNFLPAEPDITGGHRQLQNSAAHGEDVNNLSQFCLTHGNARWPLCCSPPQQGTEEVPVCNLSLLTECSWGWWPREHQQFADTATNSHS